MKHKIKIIILIILLIPLKIQAENIDIKLTCPNLAAPGTIITCQITANSDLPLNGISVNYNIPKEITYNKLETKDNWQEHYNNKDGFVASKSNNSQNQTTIAHLSLKIPTNNSLNKKYSISLTNIDLSDKNYTSKTALDSTSTIKVVSDDNTLSNLIITNGTISPKFSKNQTTYTSTITQDNTTITATPSDKDAKVSGDLGQKKLNFGANYFKISVTSKLGNTKNYTLTINRPLPKNYTLSPENDASLKELTIKNYPINFQSNIYTYDLTIDNTIDTLEIIATPNSSKAHVTIEQKNPLSIGENLITITVTAEDGTTSQYLLKVNKLDKELSSNNTIKNITIENYELNFKPTKYNYELAINNEDKLNIKVKLNDPNATYKIKGNKNLENKSIITITVTAEDNSTKDYTIKITKKANSMTISNNFIIITITIIFLLALTIFLTTKVFNKNVENSSK